MASKVVVAQTTGGHFCFFSLHFTHSVMDLGVDDVWILFGLPGLLWIPLAVL